MSLFESIMTDLMDRDDQWYAHRLLIHTVPKVMAVAPYLRPDEVSALLEEAGKNRDAAVLMDLALTAYRVDNDNKTHLCTIPGHVLNDPVSIARVIVHDDI